MTRGATTGAATSPALQARLARYADELRERRAIRSDTVHAAFATVPRHRFLRTFRYRADRHTLTPGELPSDGLLDIIYANNSLVTHDGRTPGQPRSSSSGPSLMARMLEALDLRPGLRVLEIGAGTGYNSALIHTITGAAVTTIEAGNAAAAEAAAALAELGLDRHVRVIHGDGYLGDPDGGRWDRIIVTCGIAGIPPAWLDQLEPDGLILAPIAHAGVHPILAIRHADGRVTGQIAVWGDFMHATGNLRPPQLFGHNPADDITASPVRRLAGAVPAVGTGRYDDLVCFLAAHDQRTTRAYIEHDAFDPAAGMTALVDGDAAVWIQHTSSFLAAGDPKHTSPLQARLRDLVTRWLDADTPAVEHWRTHFELHPDLPASLWTPHRWQHTG